MTHKELLQQTDYKPIKSVLHSDIKELVYTELAKNRGWARIANGYQIVGLFTFIFYTFKAFIPYYYFNETSSLIWLVLGLASSFSLLIVLHELIHAAAYCWVGVHNISFGAEWHKFLFYVQADRTVLNYNQFKKVSLAPVVVVGIISFMGMILFYNHPGFNFFLPIFALHSLLCAGDFGLLCFFQNRPDKDILTFDVKEEGKTYFYGRQHQQTNLRIDE